MKGEFTAPAEGKPGQLTITARIQPGWHIYSITQAPGGPVRSKIEIEPSDQYQVGQFVAATLPEKKAEKLYDGLIVESHVGIATWNAPLTLAAGAAPSQLRILGKVVAQPCDANTCLPPQDFPFTATFSQPPAAVAQPNNTLPAAAAPIAAAPVVAAPPAEQAAPVAQFDAAAVRAATIASSEQMPLWMAMLMGFAGGAILNLMPCVLPVIGLKLLSFLEQAGESRTRALMLNIWYSLGLLSVFLLLATLAAGSGFGLWEGRLGWGELYGNRSFTITLTAVVFAMALSFLGIWEIPIPGFAGGRAASHLMRKEGALGAFAKGVLTTFLATPCTAPFLAPAFTWSLAQPPSHTYAVLGMAGLGMASPYLLVGAFPDLIRFLPKPGAWMETFKQLMGFVLLGTVVFLLTIVETAYVVPTVGLLFGIWAACWWIGRIDPLADAGERLRGWAGAVTFCGAVWLVTFVWLSGVMVQRLDKKEDFWQPFTRTAFDQNVGQRKTVMVDFTADWCLTCKTLEATVLNTDAVRQAVARSGVVAMKADWTHQPPEISAMLEALGGKQVPTLAFFPAGNPNQPIRFQGAYTQQAVLDAIAQAGPSQASSREYRGAALIGPR